MFVYQLFFVLDHCFIYTASVAASRLRLPTWAEPFAGLSLFVLLRSDQYSLSFSHLVGLMVVLIDIPYDIVSVKFVHWTWHDTDQNIYQRHYWVRTQNIVC